MDHGYSRYRKAGPAPEKQEAAFDAAGVPAERRHNDDHRKKLKPDKLWTGRENAIRCVRQGDRLLVPDAATLGVSRKELELMLRRVTERGGSVVDLSAGETVAWAPEVAAALAFAARGEAQLNRERLEPARKANPASTSRKFNGLSTNKRERIRAMWHAHREHTVAAVVAESGISRKALYDALGPRIIKEKKGG